MNILDLEWSDNLSVGVDSIDDDHKRLVSLIRELFSASFLGTGDEEIPAILKKLNNYTEYHFYREEALLRQLA
ncbi:MAG: hypothetical protein H7835_20150, partial [Magnetococcus sp. XQGC-1]